MSTLIDSHTHLESFHRAGRLEEILQRADEAGVTQFITIGTDPSDWEIYRQLAESYRERIFYTVGIHPCDVDEGWEEAAAQLEGYFAGKVAPVGLGEIGLDRFHLSKNPAEAERELTVQRAAFSAQLNLAARLDVPVVVHSRGAFLECVEAVDASGVPWANVVFHCFTEGTSAMETIIQRGGRGSFTGIVTYKTAVEVREALLRQGLDLLMVETDAPYLAPVPHRGKPNEPAFLRHTAEFCAGVFGISVEKFAAATTANSRRFFRL